MKTIGLIGGMSWESTLPYYQLINEGVKARLGGLHSARLVLYSVDFAEVEQLQRAGDWVGAGALLAKAAQALQTAGAQALVLCTNTMHKVAPAIEAAVDVSLLHIADATAAERDEVHRIIYEELCLGHVRETSREVYRRVIRSMVQQGAQAIILGCTEIGLLITPQDSDVPVFDTTVLHAQAAVDWALID